MNITLRLNNEIIKYGVCHIYSNSALSTPVILSNGNGSGANTITANSLGVISLTASNCPSSIYCKIESNPSYNNSANFRLKTNQVAGISPSASIITLNMGFTSNIFVPTDTKCAIGYDLLTLGYRYSFSKISSGTFPTSTATANLILYNKAFTYKAINSLDKTSYGSTTTQTTFGTYSAINATNMLNTTRGVNLASSNYTIQLDSLHRSGEPLRSQTAYGDKYTIDGVTANIAGYTISGGDVIANYTITPAVEANNGYILTCHAANYPGITSLANKGTNMNYAYNSGWIPLTCFVVPITSQLDGIIINSSSNASLFTPYSLILTYNYLNNILSTNIAVTFCLCEIDETADWDDGYYKPLSFCTTYYGVNATGSAYTDDIYIPIDIPIGKNGSSTNFNYNTPNSFYFKQNTVYALFVRVIVGTPSYFTYVRLGANVNGSLNTRIIIEIPEKVVTFEKVGKSPLVPVYMGLKSTILSCKLSYLQISYPNHSYSLGNANNTLGKDTTTSQLKWLNANPAKIGVSGSVSYTNLYSGINVSAKDTMSSERDVYSYTYIAIASPAVCYNGFTTTSWYKLQSTKSYITNNAFEGVLSITSTNIKYSINELLSGKHKLTEIYVRVDS